MLSKLVIANWKMNTRLAGARELLAAVQADALMNHAQVAIAAPVVYLSALAADLQAGGLVLAAQDVSHFAEDGAYTGEVSAAMLADCACRYVLVGHSERRQYFAENAQTLLSKLRNVLSVGMVPVLCVGETLAEREAGDYLALIESQLSVLAELTPSCECIVAYEPVWAIGTGKVASLAQIDEIHAAIKKWCLQNAKASAKIRVLYGGSVKAENAASILALDNVDGALVGGASLELAAFRVVCQAARQLV